MESRGPVEQKIFDIMKTSLASTTLALETYFNGTQEAIRVGNSEIADDPAVEMLLTLAKGLVESVSVLAKEIDDLK